jgi:nucleoside-diphosphate-sugar epimerase
VVLAVTRGQSGERYIVTAHNISMPDLASAALQAVGTPRRVFVPSPAAIERMDGLLALLTRMRLNPGMRPLAALNVDKVYSTEKIRRDLGWEPSYSLEETLRDALGGDAAGSRL